MGSTHSYHLKDGSRRWEHRYRRPDGVTTRKRGFRTKRSALAWAAKNDVELGDGTWVDRSRGRLTVAEAAQRWLEVKAPTVAPKTADQYANAVKHISETGRLGGVPLAKVRPSTVEAWIAALVDSGLSPKTVRNYAQPLSQIFDRAVRDGRIARSPYDGIELPRVERKQMTIPTPDQITLLAQAAGVYGPVVEFLAGTGLRWGEMAGLQVQDVDHARGRVHVRRQLYEVGGRLREGPPKHGTTRLVPTTARVAQLLEERATGGAADLVWTTVGGAPLRNGNARRGWWNRAAEAAGLPGYTPHGLRHYFASSALAAGVSIRVLADVMGHSSAAFCLRQYSHLLPDSLDSFAATLDARVRPASTGGGTTGGREAASP